MPYKLKVKKDLVTIEDGADDLLSKLIDGCEGNVTINTPFGQRKIKRLKKGNKKIRKLGKPKRAK